MGIEGGGRSVTTHERMQFSEMTHINSITARTSNERKYAFPQPGVALINHNDATE